MKEQVLRIETLYSKPVGTIVVNLEIQINRPLTSEENHDLSSKLQEITKMLGDNSLKTSAVFQVEVEQEYADLLACFSDRLIYAKAIPNGYHGGTLKPWFEVTTRKGIIEIGWRKRVISINWCKSDIREYAQMLFPDEETTKTQRIIHAWGYEKAKEYIDILLKS